MTSHSEICKAWEGGIGGVAEGKRDILLILNTNKYIQMHKLQKFLEY